MFRKKKEEKEVKRTDIDLKRKKEVRSEEDEFDKALFSRVQPIGGITFADPRTIKTGLGYINPIKVTKLPKELKLTWLDNIFNMDNTIVTMDIHTDDVNEVKKKINRSLQEENVQRNTAKNYSEFEEADRRQTELQAIYDELSNAGDILKSCDFRIFVPSMVKNTLDEKTAEIINTLKGNNFESSIFLNEGEREWRSLFESHTKTHKKKLCFRSLPLLARQIAYGNPFHYSELIDKRGMLIGFTDIGGAVLFDNFEVTEHRTNYNMLECGQQGSGKSTLSKKFFSNHAMQGDFIRNFDPTGEYTDLTKEFGGKILNCDGTEGILNPFEILKSADDESMSYARHITKLVAFFQCIMPTIETTVLEKYLGSFYESLGLSPKNGNRITGLGAKRYPILEEFENYLESELEKKKNMSFDSTVEEGIAISEAQKLNTLLANIRNLVTNYGAMFNGHTSIDNISDEKIVTFNIESIKDLGNIFVAQMFNLVSLCWDNAVQNGKIMKDMWERGELDVAEITKFFIITDESHLWINTSMPKILDMIIRYCREARKYFAGILLASQSIRDFAPEGESGENFNAIKTLFELMQYKFLFRLDSANIPYINTLFRASLSLEQVEQIPTLNKGYTILSISGDKSIKFKVWLSMVYEAGLFRGGR